MYKIVDASISNNFTFLALDSIISDADLFVKTKVYIDGQLIDEHYIWPTDAKKGVVIRNTNVDPNSLIGRTLNFN